MVDFGFIWYDPYYYELLTYRFYEIFCYNVLKTSNQNIWLCNKRIGNIMSLMEIAWSYAMVRRLTLGFDWMVLSYAMTHCYNIWYGKLIQWSTAQIVGLADSYGLNDIMVDGTALYCAIIILHGSGNPITFARIQLILSSLSAAAVSHNLFFDPVHCFVRFEPYYAEKPWLQS